MQHQGHGTLTETSLGQRGAVTESLAVKGFETTIQGGKFGDAWKVCDKDSDGTGRQCGRHLVSHGEDRLV